MSLFSTFVAFLFAFLFTQDVTSLASTDTITWGGDNSRTGYQTNHNMDPSTVGGSSFGQLFRVNLPGNFQGIGPEQIFSQPLVYTGSDGIQYVYVATTQNNVYKINAKTGAIVASRNLHVPFLTADLDGCVDINPTVGVTATGVIDPETGYWYLTSKTYSDAFQSGMFSKTNPPGRLNGRYYFHAINTADLSEVSGFPQMIDGLIFRNSNGNRMFIGGNQHARPGMLQVGDYIYTGWASHCVQYNFTGAIIGFHRKTGAVVESFAMEGGPEPNTVKGAGVWMSGGGIAYDGKGSIFLASGNGYASQLAATGNALSGRQPPTSLEEAAVTFALDQSTGRITPVDFFMPWEKTQLDGADKDLGTSPLQLLPSDVFSCANIKRLGFVTGKSGKSYLLNLDSLGGYQQGANRLDAAVQVIQNENSVYAGAGVMPLGGGYIYINVIQYQTHVYKFSCSNGNPQLTLVANTPEKNAYILGVGHGTTTSLNGQDGTGLIWVSDVEGFNLRVYNAIPDNGNLTLIKSFNVPGVTKFSRPVFGDGIAYVGTTLGYLYAFGSPVNLPLNCSSPYTFPNTPIGSTSSPITIICKANIGVTVTGVALSGNTNFGFSTVATPLTLAAGQTFSLNATFSPGTVGLLSSDILVNTTNNVAQYSASTPITLKGTANSAKALLAIAPNTVSFNVVAGQQAGGVSQSSLFSNRGDTLLNIQNIMYSTTSETGPWVTPNITADGSAQVGYFTFSSVPQTIDANSVATVGINYNPSVAGNHAVYLKIVSDGGSSLLDVLGVAGTQPVTLIEFQTPDGSGWVTYQPGVPFTFGNVTEGTTVNLKMRVTNNGTSSAVPLSITVSKPPYGVSGLIAAVNNVDLAEGTLLQAGQNQTATLFCSVPRSQVNIPSYNGSAVWTINTGDPTLGKQIIQFSCNAVAEQVGPLLSNGSALYPYVGCFRENTPGRQLATNPFSGSDTTNDKCIAKCYSLGYKFAGTQYQSECWCGNAIPLQMDGDSDCNYNCAGNANQTCGGNGYAHNAAHISLFADSTKFNGSVSNQTLRVVPSYNGYNYIGCYADGSGGKTVSAAASNTNTMTIEACGDFCVAKGYNLFGVEYASECYCGKTITSTSTLADDSKCSMSCKGSNAEYCGAGGFMSMYGFNMTKGSAASSSSSAAGSSSSATGTTTSTTASSSSAVPTANLSGYIYMGCYNETHDRRALADAGRRGVSTNSLESCAAFCSGYAYFGVEYGSECYCGNTLYLNSIKQSSEAGCSMACAGNSAENCGGPDFLNIYMANNTASTSSTSSTTATSGSTSIAASGTSSSTTGSFTVSSSTTSTALATPTGPVAKQTVGSYVYQGCYTEVPGRALTATSFSNSSNSLEFCASFCASYTYFATEYASECYCGNTLSASSIPATDGRCNAVCSADKSEYCGGGNGLSLYKKGLISSSSSSSSTSSSVISTSSTLSSSVSSIISSSSSAPSVSSVSSGSSVSTPTSSSSTSSVSSTISSTPLSCPGSNSTQFQTTSGSTYLIECFTDHSGGDMAGSPVYVTTLESCISACDAKVGCVDVSWVNGNPGPCYLKSSVGTAVKANNVYGAKFISKASSSTSSSSSTISSVSSTVTNRSSTTLSTSSASTSSTASSSSSSVASSSTSSTITSSSSSIPSSTDSMSSSSSVSSSVTSNSVSSSVTSSSSQTSSSTGISSSTSASTDSSSSSSTASSTASSSSSTASSTISSSSSSVSSTSTASSTTMSSSSSSVSTSSTSSIASSSSTSTASSISSSSSVLSTSSSSKSTSATPTGPTVIPTVSSYVAQGCYSEGNGRALAALSYTNSSMTPALCAAKCTQYAWFGVEYATECYCGPYLRSGSVQVSDSDCSMSCAGNKTALCGAGNRLNIYYSNDTNKASTDPRNLDTAGTYSFYSCYKDNTRALSVTQANDNMTVGNCQALAAAGNYAWFGVEYGRECWMGNSLTGAGASNATSSDCNMACKGNPGQLCGGPSRLSLYQRSS